MGRDDVLVTAGAAQALFIIATTLLDKGDHLVVVRPNYATNIETPRALEADVSCLELAFDEGFRIDPDELMALVTPRTKYVSITLPHNPTGVTMGEADLRSLVGRVEAAGCRLLVDETYREMTFGERAAGRRVAQRARRQRRLAVQDLRHPRHPQRLARLPRPRAHDDLSRREGTDRHLRQRGRRGDRGARLRAAPRLAAADQRPHPSPFRGGRSPGSPDEELMEWVQPRGGCVCFPRIKPDVPLDVDAFYRVLNERHGAYVGPGHWFEQSRRHMRIGYAWPLQDELEGGLAAISSSLRAALDL